MVFNYGRRSKRENIRQIEAPFPKKRIVGVTRVIERRGGRQSFVVRPLGGAADIVTRKEIERKRRTKGIEFQRISAGEATDFFIKKPKKRRLF